MLEVQKKDDQNEKLDIQQMTEGDVAAFNRLYERYHKSVHVNILKLVKSPELATELLQDVFLALWQNRFKFENKESVGGWLFVVSYNKSLNILRSKIREAVEYVADYPAEVIADTSDREEEERYAKQMALLDEAVDILPARKREVFKLCRYEGHSKEDVAEMLGISPQSVTDYLKQSNKTIKEYVLQHYPGYMLLFFFILNS
ncbi:RNA polymerase sigma factor [Sphingobacterium sp. LRF_L2]|uniref:RNA polymerase sigma factor n=1 Tax=Sphingobacterium sp. LRF_L2 TaxID=3369421 RepID=UPI003F64778F